MSNPSTYPATVSAAVREAIRAAGVSQLAVSQGAFIPYATLGRRLADVQPFTVEELARIAGYLEIPVHTLTAPGLAA